MLVSIKNTGKISVAALIIAVISTASLVYAANTPELSQIITAGVLSTDILDASRVPVASPTAALTTKAFEFTCQSGAGASTGTLGTGSQRLYVMNPDAADNGWTLTMAATAGATAVWENGGATQTFDFNDPTTSGCADGGDADSRPGQLTVDPSVGTLTTDCVACTSTAITLGSSAAYSQAVTDSVTLINAASGSNDVWRGYLTGVGLSQTIPAEQAVDTYTVDMTLTATAL